MSTNDSGSKLQQIFETKKSLNNNILGQVQNGAVSKARGSLNLFYAAIHPCSEYDLRFGAFSWIKIKMKTNDKVFFSPERDFR